MAEETTVSDRPKTKMYKSDNLYMVIGPSSVFYVCDDHFCTEGYYINNSLVIKESYVNTFLELQIPDQDIFQNREFVKTLFERFKDERETRKMWSKLCLSVLKKTGWRLKTDMALTMNVFYFWYIFQDGKREYEFKMDQNKGQLLIHTYEDVSTEIDDSQGYVIKRIQKFAERKTEKIAFFPDNFLSIIDKLTDIFDTDDDLILQKAQLKKVYIALGDTYNQRNLLKQKGFHWNPEKKRWESYIMPTTAIPGVRFKVSEEDI